MATLKLIENPARRSAANPKRRKTTKRRNPSTASKAVVRTASNPAKKRRRRRNTSVTTLTKTAANPATRRRRSNGVAKRRNGVALRKRSNGMFGNTKETVKAVGSLLGGLVLTNIAGSIFSPILSRPLASLGVGNFAKPAVEAVIAVTVGRWGGKMVAGEQGAKFAMIGGLAIATMSLIQQLLPQTSVYNPFSSPNTSPLVLNQPTVIDAATAAQIAAATQGGNAAKVGRVGVNYRRPMVASPRY